MDLLDIKRRIENGEGATLAETKELLAFMSGEKFDVTTELQNGLPEAYRCVRAIMTNGESETAQIAAAQFWIKQHNENVIADEGQILVAFDLMDPEASKPIEEETPADGVQNQDVRT